VRGRRVIAKLRLEGLKSSPTPLSLIEMRQAPASVAKS
jgi:hypothetical protein